MKKLIVTKLLTIAALMVLLLIPLSMIYGVIDDRQTLSREVAQDIARSSTHNQRITGPLLVVPYRKTVRSWRTGSVPEQRIEEITEVEGRLYFLPERFELTGKLRTEQRSRGIYRTRLYHSDTRLAGHFQLPARLGLGADFGDYRFQPPFLAVGISDIRGIGNALRLDLDGTLLDFLPGSQSLLGDGVHAVLPPIDAMEPQRIAFGFDLQLQGTGQLEIMPAGRETVAAIAGDWPHPSFMGAYLPLERKVDANGFAARWQTTFFATGLEQALDDCARENQCKEFGQRLFGVNLVDPVDHYLKSERAIKYALLFIALTFACFFLFEVLKRLAVHPVQYALVGAALAMFYLLLLSLSEHIGFGAAYAVSGSACVLLIGFYVSHVLRSFQRGIGFAGGLAALYGLLYGLLSAEDYALLMGSLLLFGVLGLIMALTRKLDWYRLEQPPSA